MSFPYKRLDTEFVDYEFLNRIGGNGKTIE